MRAAGLAATAALVLAAGVRAGELELKLTVGEPAGVERKAGPARGGIPLPRGVYRKDQQFAVFDGAEAVPAQVLPLVVDAEGFLRWVLVDTQVDLPAGGSKELTLRLGENKAAPPAALKVANDDKGLTVDTGRIRFTIARGEPFSLFSSVEAGGKPVVAGGQAGYTDATVPGAEPKRYAADKPESIDLEYSGPMAVTARVTGRFVGDDRSKLRYMARVTAWAGRSDVHVKYSLVNSNPDQYVYRRISDYSVALKLAGEPSGTLVGADKPLEAGAEAWLKQGLITHWYYYGGVRPVPGASVSGSGANQTWASASEKDHALGWIAAKTAAGTVFACDRFFFENPPRALAVEKGALVLRGVIERFDGPEETFYKGTKNERTSRVGHPFRSKVRWLLDCNRLSSDYVIDFAAPEGGEALVGSARAARQMLHVTAPAAWYSDTECLEIGRFCTEADELRCYETWGWKYEQKEIPRGPGFDRYGGSEGTHLRQTSGVDHHYDTEHDTLESLVLMYLRTGKRPHFERATAWANFGMDTEFFRSDGWRWKDGGIWWTKGGPAGGSRPQRPADPVTGLRDGLPPQWSKGWAKGEGQWGAEDGQAVGILADSRTCYCHNYAGGMAAWFCITGERDAFDAVIDQLEQNHDMSTRHYVLAPGKNNSFSRDFTRQARVAMAARTVAPADEFVIAASDLVLQTYLKRPRPEPRGFVNPANEVAKQKQPADAAKVIEAYRKHTGDPGIEDMKKRGVEVDPETGALVDKQGHKWNPVVTPQNFMYPMLYIGVDCYARTTGDEDAADWIVALGKAFGQIAYQRHGNFAHYSILLVDFPVRGVCLDKVSWETPADNKYGEGVGMSGYTAKFWPDACARAYRRCGEPLLKQRAYDYWFAGSHRGYAAKNMHKLGGVGAWLNYYVPREDFLVHAVQTFDIHAHPRADQAPPKAVADLAATVAGERATVSFTAPADEGGGKVARYQLKCSDRPIVSYEDFLKAWEVFTDEKVTNWWMAANFKDEPVPQAPGAAERFTVSGVPAGAKYFAVRSFDDSENRSALSNVAEAGK